MLNNLLRWPMAYVDRIWRDLKEITFYLRYLNGPMEDETAQEFLDRIYAKYKTGWRDDE